MMNENFDASKVTELLTKLSMTKDENEQKAIRKQLEELSVEYASDDEDVDIDYESVFDGVDMRDDSEEEHEEEEEPDDDVPDSYFAMSTSDLLKYINKHKNDGNTSEDQHDSVQTEDEPVYETGDDIIRRMMQKNVQVTDEPVVEESSAETTSDEPQVASDPEPEHAHTEEITNDEVAEVVEVHTETEPSVTNTGVFLNGEKL